MFFVFSKPGRISVSRPLCALFSSLIVWVGAGKGEEEKVEGGLGNLSGILQSQSLHLRFSDRRTGDAALNLGLVDTVEGHPEEPPSYHHRPERMTSGGVHTETAMGRKRETQCCVDPNT